VRLGDIANPGALSRGKPLDGIKVLALEQMQALPYCTQLLARLGATVVKVESTGGDMGRGSVPSMADPQGRAIGATFLRNNLNKASICVNLKDPRGRDLILELAKRFDVIAENFKPRAMARLGLAYEDIAAVNPSAIYLSVSGFGATVPSPYDHWPALASVVEAMSGIYELKRVGDQPPMVAPVGGLGDLSAALFACIGVLAALRDRDRTGEGQYVDISMMDTTVAMTDIVANFWSLGVKGGEALPIILSGFRANDGWFIIQVGREAHFAKLAEFIGHPEWATDPRFATRQGWLDHLETVLRPAIEAWAGTRTRLEASDALASAGIPAGPCFTDAEMVADPHLAARDMLVEMPRVDGVEQPVLTPGNPVRMSKVARGPETRVPWLGEHTDEVLSGELGLTADELAVLREAGAIA
jgi:crotonobetainyl-CoA:carnitine CoA-transferase CaiB-like acyl-CoA transferase